MRCMLLCLAAGACAASMNAAAGCADDKGCNMAGECVAGACVCDQGWGGTSCQLLDLVPQASREAGAAYNSRTSANSSWCIAPRRDPKDGRYHVFVSEMAPGCGLSTWLPGSRIIHATADTPDGPFTFEREVRSTFHHNPHISQAPDGTYLLYFNGRRWPADDIGAHCRQNTSGPGAWHGGGSCGTAADCHGGRNECKAGKCVCERHSFGATCGELTETVNLMTSAALEGPWAQLLPDGAPFFADGNTSLGLSNPAAWPLPNGTIVLAYSRAPNLGIAVAPSWRGPYTRLTMPGSNGSNYSLINPPHGGEDPFLYRDHRGTWRVIFHGYGGDGKSTDGQSAWSTDLVHWTWQPVPVYSSTISYADGSREVFTRRERPALLFDADGHPTHLYNAVQPPNQTYSGKSYSYVQRLAGGGQRTAGKSR